ncbi:MAG: IS200/IS605 family transposase [Treponema sp.]|nr:IS200/IS605 family transposase [Treponema sp.]MBR0125502.1 IS200/IS605 family transposase [Treponema sp.]
MYDYQSLSHSKWECKYHVVFIPKYRKKKLYGSIRTDLGEELHRLAEQKESKILEGHMMSDHIHMLILIPPKYSVTQVIGYIKGKSAIYVAQGYFVSTVGLDEDVIRNYIRDQEEDRRQDGQQQLSL